MSRTLAGMVSITRLISNNSPSAKPELWGNLGGVVRRRLSAWLNAKLDSEWPSRPLITTIEPEKLMLEVIPSDVIGMPIARFGVYEFALSQLIRAYLTTTDVFVDVGANIGYYSVIASNLVGPAGRVFAFEPSPRVRARLVRNITLNGMTNNVEVRSEAVSEECGIVRLVEPNGGGNDGLAYVDLKATGGGVEVTAVRLDGVPELRSRLPDLIKVDVEGGEAAVFRGASMLLREEAAPTILFESFDISRDAAILRQFGYDVFQPGLLRGQLTLHSDITAPSYRRWEAPNFLAVKGARGRRFVEAYRRP